MTKAALALVLTIGLSTPLAAAGGLPPTEREPVTDVMHGVEIVDPYRWLEGSAAPEIESPDDALDRRVAAWTDAQNAYTREILDSIPGRAELESRLRELMEVGSVSAPTMRGNRYFYTMREGDQDQAVLYVREGHDGTPRELVNPNEIDSSGLTTLSWHTPSHDGSIVAFGMYEAGDENSVLYLIDVDSGDWLAEEIPGKVTSVNWLPDGTGFFYRRLRDLDDPYSAQIRFHRLGTHHRQAPVLFEQYTEGPLAWTWGPYAYTSRDARWMILGYWTSTSSVDLWVVDLDHWSRTGEFEKVEIITGEDARFSGPVLGDTLYMQTTHEAPNGRIVAVDLHNPSPEHWRELVPERDDMVLRGVSAARGMLALSYQVDAADRIELVSLTGEHKGEVDLPGIGSASISTSEDRTEAFLTFTSFNMPRSIYRLDLRSGDRELWERPDVPVDPSMVEVKQEWFTSKDGTRVPMFIVHRKGLELDGDNPTILSGYGGFNISRTPSFSATLFPWFEEGGVYVVANIRGGGEFGQEWHRAGMRENRQNVFDDFIAAAEHLIASGYTHPERLGIVGGSNGGLLVGAVATQRPDLFGAVLCAVPLLDMLRFEHFLMARYWVPEYGSAEHEEDFHFLVEYSPYHNIEEGVEYPAMLITTGENDTRVHPFHARKMAAKLQHATASDPTERPILLWVDRDSGHGAGKPLHIQIRDVADMRLFMMWQLGMIDR